MSKSLAVLWLVVTAVPLGAQAPPKAYTAYRAAQPLRIDGGLDEAAWRAAPWSEDFVDIEGDRRPAPRLRTRMKMLWDDGHLYVAAELEEPHVWATLCARDAVIFQDNDFEIFLDPDGDARNYAELEVNALNAVWDLFLAAPYRDGGRADDAWTLDGLRTAVRVIGTLNAPADTDSGWTVEIAIPWRALERASGTARAPEPGARWRVNFSRVQWRTEIATGAYRKVAGQREDNWVWSPQGMIDMHQPERWGWVEFSPSAPPPPATSPARRP